MSSPKLEVNHTGDGVGPVYGGSPPGSDFNFINQKCGDGIQVNEAALAAGHITPPIEQNQGAVGPQPAHVNRGDAVPGIVGTAGQGRDNLGKFIEQVFNITGTGSGNGFRLNNGDKGRRGIFLTPDPATR